VIRILRVIELFAGIGAYAKSLKRLEIKHEIVSIIEFDKHKIKCYNKIHSTNFEPADITKLTGDELPDCDMICYSPPCQTFSVAGRQEGFDDIRGTLFFDALRIIQKKKPKFALMENVKGLTQKKFVQEFKTMLDELEKAGYKNYWKVLNAKDYGIPQNRERVFIVSARNDIDCDFVFPNGFDNEVRLRDILEENVDEKYFISEDKCKKLLEELKELKNYNDARNDVCIPVLTPERVNKRQNGRRFKTNGDPSFTITSQDKHGVAVIGRVEGINGPDILKRVYDPNGISPTLDSCSGGNRQPKIIIDDTQGFDGLRIRKLTPLECIRLMGFDDLDYQRLKQNKVSDTQIYRCCGDSIVVDVLDNIFDSLLCPSILQK
jgi:DNA (cytosine-5)-methyltransferase 1